MGPEIRLTQQNYDLLRRLDEDKDGQITSAEAKHAIDHAGFPSEVKQQLAALAPEDQKAVRILQQASSGVLQVTFGDHQVRGESSWLQAERSLQAAVANTSAAQGKQGQGRVAWLEGDGNNYDCGQTVGQYLNDRRLKAAGQAVPSRTYAEADAIVAADSFGAEGSSSSEMQAIVQKRYGTAGNQRYTFQRDMFTNADQMEAALRRGLQSDPAGVMVPINYKRTTESEPAPHWIAVTGLEANGSVHYFDPGGLDGSQHERTMTLNELRGAAVYNLPQIGVVYGQANQPAPLPVGTQLAELEVRFSNRAIKVTDYVGRFSSKDVADQQAKLVAKRESMDTMVVKDGNQFAVYGVTEIRTQFGGLWSDNTLTEVNPNVVSAFMTDPRTKAVRAAHLP